MGTLRETDGARAGGPGGTGVDTQLDGGKVVNLRDLTALAVDGQPAAIDTLLRQIRPMVVRYCRARLSRMTGYYQVADDVAQEVCIAVLSALPRYQDMGRPFASFVFGIASHKVADAMRNASRLAIPTEDLPDGPDDRPGPEETVVAYIEAERVRSLLARLPLHQRELLVLRVLTGLSAEETGRALGMSAGRGPGRAAPGHRAAPRDGRRRGVHRLTTAPDRRRPAGIRAPPWQGSRPTGPPGSVLPPSRGSRRAPAAGRDPCSPPAAGIPARCWLRTRVRLAGY